ncbi:MAG: arginine--tRNA ligase [Cyanobacteria bacterium P01_H01_bin.121]
MNTGLLTATSPKQLLEQALQQALVTLNYPVPNGTLVTASKFADYQSAAPLQLAKTLDLSPMEIAAQIQNVFSLDAVDLEISQPGFLNFYLDEYLLAEFLFQDVAIPQTEQPQAIALDYSGPNLAKPMHPGHLKSTLVGDALASMLQAQGNTVTSLNHFGDFGLPLAIAIAYSDNVDSAIAFDDLYSTAKAYSDNVDSAIAFDDLYSTAKAYYEANPEFQALAQAALLQLQQGKYQQHPLVAQSYALIDSIYDQLDIKPMVNDAESLYADYLPAFEWLATEDQGALIMPLLDENLPPLMYKKSNGAYTYAATDLAALLTDNQAKGLPLGSNQDDQFDCKYYLTDAGQALHFQQVFKLASETTNTKLQHLPLGLMLGPNGKKLSSSKGTELTLQDLIDKAIAAFDGNQDLAIASLKYAILSQNPYKTSVFDLDQMLATKGNTATYLLYTASRAQGILKNATSEPQATAVKESYLPLTLQILGFEDVFKQAITELAPYLLTEYLFELAKLFNQLYEIETLSTTSLGQQLALQVHALIQVTFNTLNIKFFQLDSPQ